MLGRLILLIIFLVAVVTVIQLFRNTPKSQLKNLYWKFGLSAIAIALVLLALTGRIHWIGAAIGAALPILRRALPSLIRYFPLLQQLRRQHQQHQKTTASSSAGSNRSQVDTRILKMTLDHDSNRLYGEVISGPFAGQQLDAMPLAQLQDLLDYCHREEKDSAKLLITYLNHRFGNNWQQQQQTPPPHNGPLDERAAYAILGLQKGASKQDIVDAHRRMMAKMHPDRGGSDYLAAQINEAKELLMKRVA